MPAKPSVANPVTHFPPSTAGVWADRLPEDYPREFDAIVVGSGMGGAGYRNPTGR